MNAPSASISTSSTKNLRLALGVFALGALACSSTSSTTDGPVGHDLAASSGDLATNTAADLATNSTDLAGVDLTGPCCGQPGDVGNSLGVGKYCTGFSDCTGLSAAICSVIGDANTHFCTMLCSGAGASCGTGATCQCQGSQCGCVPDSCLTMPPGC